MQSGLYRTGGLSALAGPIITARGRPRRAGARIAAIATSHSERSLTQRDVLDRLELAGDEFAEGIFDRCGVQRRRLELSDDFLELSLQARTARVEHELLAHSVRAIDALDVDPRDVGTLLTASLYSLGCPTLAHRLIEHYAMQPTTDKYHLTGVGCASAVPLMRLGAQALRSDRERPVLVVAAESMSGLLRRASDGDPRAKTVGSAIFGDGCAAALLSADPSLDGPLIAASQVHQIAGTLGAVSLELDGDDSHLHLARELPDVAGAELGAVVDRFLARHELSRAAIDHWIVHPGGRRIIENVQSALDLADADVEQSWNALAEHGNIGTPSILYVLKHTIDERDPAPGERGLVVTIGPGVTVGLMLLAW